MMTDSNKVSSTDDRGRSRHMRYHVVAVLLMLICGGGLLLFVAFPVEDTVGVLSAKAPPKRLLLISIDGFKYDYMDLGLTPTLERIGISLKAATEYTKPLGLYGYQARLLPQFPSYTFPNHYSLVTGLHPVEHGIVANVFYDHDLNDTFYRLPEVMNDPKWWLAPPIWKTAEDAGIKSGILFWPGSEVETQRPTFSQPFNDSWSSMERVKKLLEWIDEPAGGPTFLAMYLNELDTAGHVYGPNSTQVKGALMSIDRAIGFLLDALLERGKLLDTNIIIVSDHGMSHVKPQNNVYIEDLLPNADERVIWAGLGPVTLISPKEGQLDEIYEVLARSIARLNVPVALYKRDSLPREYHYRRGSRVPAIIMECQHGWSIGSRAFPWKPLGQHGYNPIIPEMHALFLAAGPDIVERDLDADPTTGMASNLDVYNLLAALLRLEARPNSGSRLLVDSVLRKVKTIRRNAQRK